MKHLISLGVFFFLCLATSDIQANDEFVVQIKSGTLVITRLDNKEPYLEPLERLLPADIRRVTKKYPDLENFIKKNSGKYCAYRRIKYATSPFWIGTFIQVFKNKEAANNFSQIGLKIKEPLWAPGVIGIIGFSWFDGEMLEAEEFDGKSVRDLLEKRVGLDPITIKLPELFPLGLSPRMNKPKLRLKE